MNKRKIWILISALGLLCAIYWAYAENKQQNEREIVVYHTKAMLSQLGWIDFSAVSYEELLKEGLADDSSLSGYIKGKFHKIFKDNNYFLGEEKDKLLNEIGKSDIKWKYSRKKLLERDIEDWIQETSLSEYENLDTVISYFCEKYSELKIEGYVNSESHFPDFYKLRDFLRVMEKKYTRLELKFYDYVNIYLPMIISILSIIAWFHGTLYFRKKAN